MEIWGLRSISGWKWSGFQESDEKKQQTGWWFQIFFIFTPTWGRFQIWLIFFKWVETTNQQIVLADAYRDEQIEKPERRTVISPILNVNQFGFFAIEQWKKPLFV